MHHTMVKTINNPAASSGVCCFGKVFVSGYIPLFRPKGRGMYPPHTITRLVLIGALLTMGLTACEPDEEPTPNTLTITGIPAELPNTTKEIVAVSLLSQLGDDQASSTVFAIGLGSGNFNLYHSDGESYDPSNPWTGTGDYYIVLATTAFPIENRGDPPNYTYTNGIKFAEDGKAIKYSFTGKDTTIPWSEFDKQPE